VPIAANLRHDQLDEVITDWLLTRTPPGAAADDTPSPPNWPSPSAWRGT
jgi:hypothetical protein